MRTLALFAMIGLWSLSGCAKPESETPKPPPAAPQPAAAATPTPAPTAPAAATPDPLAALQPPKAQGKQWPRPERKSAEKVLVDANTPEAVVEQVSKAISADKYQVLWEVLPDKHQADIKALVTEFTDRMDPPLYNQVVLIVELLTKSLEKHKDRFFSLPVSSETPVPKEKLQKAWDPIVELCKALLDSELYDLDELKQVDMPAFMAATMPRVVAAVPAIIELGVAPGIGTTDYVAIIESLKSVKASRVSGDDNKAVIKIEAEGRDPVEVEFIKIDGKWIPSMLDQEWPNLMKQLRDVVTLAPDKSDKTAVQNAFGALIFVAITASQLHKADTDKDFEKLVRAMINFIPKPDAKGGDAKADDKKPKSDAPSDKPETPSDKPDEAATP